MLTFCNNGFETETEGTLYIKLCELERLNKFSLSKLQMEKNFAILRHCELVHGFKENGKIMIKVWGEDTLGKMNIAD